MTGRTTLVWWRPCRPRSTAARIDGREGGDRHASGGYRACSGSARSDRPGSACRSAVTRGGDSIGGPLVRVEDPARAAMPTTGSGTVRRAARIPGFPPASTATGTSVTAGSGQQVNGLPVPSTVDRVSVTAFDTAGSATPTHPTPAFEVLGKQPEPAPVTRPGRPASVRLPTGPETRQAPALVTPLRHPESISVDLPRAPAPVTPLPKPVPLSQVTAVPSAPQQPGPEPRTAQPGDPRKPGETGPVPPVKLVRARSLPSPLRIAASAPPAGLVSPPALSAGPVGSGSPSVPRPARRGVPFRRRRAVLSGLAIVAVVAAAGPLMVGDGRISPATMTAEGGPAPSGGVPSATASGGVPVTSVTSGSGTGAPVSVSPEPRRSARVVRPGRVPAADGGSPESPAPTRTRTAKAPTARPTKTTKAPPAAPSKEPTSTPAPEPSVNPTTTRPCEPLDPIGLSAVKPTRPICG